MSVRRKWRRGGQSLSVSDGLFNRPAGKRIFPRLSRPGILPINDPLLHALAVAVATLRSKDFRRPRSVVEAIEGPGARALVIVGNDRWILERLREDDAPVAAGTREDV